MKSRALHLPLLLTLVGFHGAAVVAAQAPVKQAASKQSTQKRADSTKAAAGSVTAQSSCPQGSMLAPAAFIAIARMTAAAQRSGNSAAPSSAVMPSDPTALTCATVADVQAYMQTVALAMAASRGAMPGMPNIAQGFTAGGAAAALAGGGTSMPSAEAMTNVAKTALTVMVPGAALIGGASAAAPAATGFVKGLGSHFGRGESAESMTKDLLAGRLVVKGIRFIQGSDAFADGADQSIATLASALQGIPGAYAMRLPIESDGKTAPDTALTRRRLERVAGHLQLSGITDARVVLVDPAAAPPTGDKPPKPPKPGDARIELVRAGQPTP